MIQVKKQTTRIGGPYALTNSPRKLKTIGVNQNTNYMQAFSSGTNAFFVIPNFEESAVRNDLNNLTFSPRVRFWTNAINHVFGNAKYK